MQRRQVENPLPTMQQCSLLTAQLRGQSKTYLNCYPKDSSQSEELVKDIYAFASNIHRIEDNKRQWSGK